MTSGKQMDAPARTVGITFEYELKLVRSVIEGNHSWKVCVAQTCARLQDADLLQDLVLLLLANDLHGQWPHRRTVYRKEHLRGSYALLKVEHTG